MMPTDTPMRCGFVALIGAPNAGKSTLLNQLVGQKIAIVSHKVQTTRTRITGIAMAGDSQLIFMDTPGIFAPRRRLDRAMVNAAWTGAGDADVIVLLLDAARGIDEEAQGIIDGLKQQGRTAIAAINKIDLVKRDSLLALTAALDDTGVFDQIFMISALTGDGVSDLRDYLATSVPEGPWHYPEDQVTDVTQRLLAAEIMREKIYLRLHQELPYATTVETEKWEERRDGSVKIDQVIHVQRKSQKGIVIGKGGATLKLLGEQARTEMEEVFERRVHLFVFVRVSEGWADDKDIYRDMGLDYVD